MPYWQDKRKDKKRKRRNWVTGNKMWQDLHGVLVSKGNILKEKSICADDIEAGFKECQEVHRRHTS